MAGPPLLRIDGRIDLNAQARDRIIVGREFDARHDAFGDRQRRSAGRKSIRQYRILDLRQLAGTRHRRMGVEETRIVQLQHRQVDSRRDGEDGGRYLVAGCIRLNLHWLA